MTDPQRSDIDPVPQTPNGPSRTVDGAGLGDSTDLDEAHDAALAPPVPGNTHYGSAEEFLVKFLLRTWRRQTPDTWCECWDEHPEARDRITALWRAWEKASTDPGHGMSNWWRLHADHHIPRLLAADGPFALCRHGHQPDPPPRTTRPAAFDSRTVDG